MRACGANSASVGRVHAKSNAALRSSSSLIDLLPRLTVCDLGRVAKSNLTVPRKTKAAIPAGSTSPRDNVRW
jgi:hypothetical protein